MKKQYIFLIINLITNTLLWGQNPAPSISSPHVYEMRRMGNIPVNLNVGQTNFSIDLLDGVPEFKKFLNLSIGYNSSGFQPNKPSNYTGLNWFLNYGGVISREINGVPDDDKFPTFGLVKGLRVLIKEVNQNKSFTNTAIFNCEYPVHIGPSNAAPGYLGNVLYKDSTAYELTSDTYYFNFANISGSFTIDMTGNVILNSANPNLRVDLSKYVIQGDGGRFPQDSEISIYDEFGNQYVFGGHLAFLEFGYALGFSSELALGNQVLNNTIDAWYLREVNLNNGQNIAYEYNNVSNKREIDYFVLDKISSTFHNAPTNDSNYWISNNNDKYNYVSSFTLMSTQYEAKKVNPSEGNILGTINSKQFVYANREQYRIMRRLFPTKITSANFSISFDYNLNKSTNNKIIDFPTLKNIKFYTKDLASGKNEKIEQIDFFHEIKQNYPLLKEIKSTSFGNYTFNYYGLNNTLPKYPTRGVDYGGFWNGGSDTENKLLTDFILNYKTGEYTIVGSNRKENIGLFNSLLLSQITYPTKGYTVLTYEPHYFSKKIENNITTNFLKLLKRENGNVGGARIKNIKNYSSFDVLTEETEYIYELNVNNAISNSLTKETNSSGISYLDYSDVEFLNYEDVFLFSMFRQFSTNLNIVTLDNSSIAYSEVAEIKNNKLYKKYYFSDYLMIPDEIGTNKTKSFVNNNWRFRPANYTNKFKNPHLDNSNKRGKLIQEDNFNEGVLQSSTFYTYQDLQEKELNSAKFSPSVIAHHRENHVFGYTTYKKLFFSYVLAEKITKYFAGSHSNTVTEIYKYDSDKHNLLTSKETIFENNDHKIERYKYTLDSSSRFVHSNGSFDLNKQFALVEQMDNMMDYFFIPDRMLFKNQINYLTSISRFKNSALLDEKVMLYSLNPKMYGQLYSELNKKKTNSELSIDLGPFMIYPVSNDEKQALDDRIKSSSLNQEYVIEKYDEFNNVLQYRDKSNIVTSFYYYNNLPVLRVVGKEYDANTDGFIYITLSENYFENFRRFIASFRTLDSYAEGYIHKPFVGMIEKIDARGNSTFYKYNESNRLESIKDSKGNVIQEFEYNFINND